ncbi:uncharacterized protein LOC119583705 isoform X7 [Penaeus monodon]|uniref:uncharacterized protein LOC119583705 isoform X7 n=1 Tax=Penaeus monodon TaxID=6687 RepID=UPI0018A743EA|nr:uncharacterized protein LOC119583705 isoform X7 [Penaeus monodon]
MLYFSEVILIILLMLKARGVHGISNKCGRTQVCREYDCTHQLQAAEMGQSCEMRFPDRLDECEYNPQMALESSLRVNLTMFYRGNGLPGKVAFNLTLQGIYTDTATKFRFHNTKFDECDLCRQVRLNNVALPHKGQLHWNCTFFEEPFYTNSNIELVVMDGRGGGNQYFFRVPEGVRTNGRANETTWQLFLLLHLSDVERENRLPVTLQLAPFGGINYTVALVKCTSGVETGCPENGTVVERKFLAGPVEAPTVARQEAVDFPVTEIGMYLVTAQIVSPRCNDCTFLSVSPPFALEANKLVPRVVGGAAALVLLVVALSGTCILCARHHREMKLKLARHPVKVLLVYLADTHAYLEFVKELASFLADNCYVQVFMVDSHAGKKVCLRAEGRRRREGRERAHTDGRQNTSPKRIGSCSCYQQISTATASRPSSTSGTTPSTTSPAASATAPAPPPSSCPSVMRFLTRSLTCGGSVSFVTCRRWSHGPTTAP